jgi:hypothetical protein
MSKSPQPSGSKRKKRAAPTTEAAILLVSEGLVCTSKKTLIQGSTPLGACGRCVTAPVPTETTASMCAPGQSTAASASAMSTGELARMAPSLYWPPYSRAGS